MEFRPLQEISIHELANTFKNAFSDFVIRLKIKEYHLKDKLTADGSDPKRYAGVLQNEKTKDLLEPKKLATAYNKEWMSLEYRGNRIITPIHKFILRNLKDADIENCV